MLIFVDRLLLGVGAQVHDLAQRVEHREMLLPVMIERLEQDGLFDLDPAVGGHVLELLLDLRVGQRLEPLDEHLGLDRFLLDPVVERRGQAEHLLGALLQHVEVPLLGIGVGRNRLADDGVHRLGAHVLDDVADVSASMMSARCS